MAQNRYSFVLPRLRTLGLSIEDYEFIKNPFDSAFEFANGEGLVSVESTYDVLPIEAQRELKHFLEEMYQVKVGSCHETAVRIGCLLEKYGVIVVDGYYTYEDGITYLHTFCKYRNRYFDPTIESVFGYKETKRFSYESVREFAPHEMRLYYQACGYDQSNNLNYAYWTSSIGVNPRNRNDEKSEYLIDDDGFLHRFAA